MCSNSSTQRNKLCNDLQSETRILANLYYNFSVQKNDCFGDNYPTMLERRLSYQKTQDEVIKLFSKMWEGANEHLFVESIRRKFSGQKQTRVQMYTTYS